MKLKPGLGIPGGATRGRLGEAVADLEEVHRITALRAEARRNLIGDPHRPITEGMDRLLVPMPAAVAEANSCRPATSTPPRRVAP